MRTSTNMRLRFLLPVALVGALASCDDVLSTEPKDAVRTERAIVDASSARAALAGAYDALQDLDYYGLSAQLLDDLSSDNAEHVGTFQYLGVLDRNRLQADNSAIADLWGQIYVTIARVNQILDKVPDVPGLSDEERNEILGEAHFIRALAFHDLVRRWGDVPMPLEPITTPGQAAALGRTPAAQVYTQILADLDAAQSLITEEDETRQASLGAVFALRSRVLLWQGTDWQGVVDAADSVIDRGYDLAPDFADLYADDGRNTPEDIFRLFFSAVEYNEMGYYYLFDGRWEAAPTADLAGTFEANDLRAPLTVAEDGGDYEGTKFPSTEGTEHLHVIRFAEVLLNKAEALARLNQLAGAVDTLNIVRARANLPALQLGVDVTDQQSVLDAIWHERRVELALEGFRFGDLVRTGQAVAVLGLDDRPGQVLYPIPQRERNVTPGLGQNAGY